VANWKMNFGGRDSIKLVEGILQGLKEPLPGEAVVCPPATALFMVGERLKNSPLQMGCQNIFYENKGAFTGEISPGFAREAGCSYVIIGHSERRQIFGEGRDIKRKVEAAIESGLKPILCVGESLEEREKGEAWSVVKSQLKAGLGNIDPGKLSGLAIAYEPVWAIGTGKSALPQDAREMGARILGELESIEGVRVLYGGSVKPENIGDFMSLEEIDGALVGGASLNADSFLKLIYWEK